MCVSYTHPTEQQISLSRGLSDEKRTPGVRSLERHFWIFVTPHLFEIVIPSFLKHATKSCKCESPNMHTNPKSELNKVLN